MMEFASYIELVKKISTYRFLNDKKVENLLFKEELGINSIKMVELIVEIENILGTEIRFEDLNLITIKTPLQLWESINTIL